MKHLQTFIFVVLFLLCVVPFVLLHIHDLDNLTRHFVVASVKSSTPIHVDQKPPLPLLAATPRPILPCFIQTEAHSSSFLSGYPSSNRDDGQNFLSA